MIFVNSLSSTGSIPLLIELFLALCNGMSEIEDDTFYLFQDPEGWTPAEKKPTFAEHVLHSGEKLNLRLVGHNPLWVSIRISLYLDVQFWDKAVDYSSPRSHGSIHRLSIL